ncbi:hypothetical protein BOTBODRAFT_374564 [Botryobasidium botryosum FD-172 SS1]|uniref:F-box domain-containing protein n=1 Tax=Botryobasidium botryosum (strain FD-172 SS1) TaxID=930990 RepID=A0A067MPB5_BOTB1|nr:hypothetical protein BOTBODRAFT_374564 [Botryobasidium botryosum FD-172 SS1]
MEHIISTITSELLQKISEQIYQDRRGKLDGTGPQPPIASAQKFPDPAYLLHETEALTAARDLAVTAINTRTSQLIAAAKIRYNNSLPINRLPDELLVMIFVFSACCHENSAYPLGARAPLNISRTSKSWRGIALHTPRLWANVDPMNISLVPMFASRSKNVLLSISLERWTTYTSRCPCCAGLDVSSPQQGAFHKAYDRYRSRFLDYAGHLRPHASAWKTLHIEGVSPEQLFQALDFPAPNLATFHAAWRREGRDIESEVQDTSSILFSGNVPNLRGLRLVGVGVPLNSPLYSGLTSLRIEGVEFIRSSVHQLCQALAGCPCLEDLFLSNIRFRLSIENGAVSGRVGAPAMSFPHLRLVWLYKLQQTAMHFLLSSISSNSSSLHLSLRLNAGTSLSTLLPISWLPALRGIPLATSLDFGKMSPIDLMFRGSAGSYLLAHDHVPGAQAAPRLLLSAIGRELLLPNLTSLTLRHLSEGAWDLADLIGMLSGLPALTTLSFGKCTTCYLTALIATPDSCLCPLLKTLRLKRSQINERSLIALALSRAPRGNRASLLPEGQSYLRRVEIYKCAQVDLTTVQVLELMSIEVEWDGRDHSSAS